MTKRNLHLRPFACAEPAFNPEAPVLARLNHSDFERARAIWPSFREWSSYDEFRTERDALLLSYGAAGVTAVLQTLTLPAFERWSRLTGAPADLDGLDEFAAHWRWRARHPKAPVMGLFGVPRFPERQDVQAAGAQVVRVRPELYLRWRDDYASAALLEAPGLDVYAAHVVECCLPSPSRARLPAVRSK